MGFPDDSDGKESDGKSRGGGGEEKTEEKEKRQKAE